MQEWSIILFVVAGLVLTTALAWVSGFLHGAQRTRHSLEWAKTYLVQRWNHSHQVTPADLDVAFKPRPQSKR
jgi:hypothetical protein